MSSPLTPTRICKMRSSPRPRRATGTRGHTDRLETSNFQPEHQSTFRNCSMRYVASQSAVELRIRVSTCPSRSPAGLPSAARPNPWRRAYSQGTFVAGLPTSAPLHVRSSARRLESLRFDMWDWIRLPSRPYSCRDVSPDEVVASRVRIANRHALFAESRRSEIGLVRMRDVSSPSNGDGKLRTRLASTSTRLKPPAPNRRRWFRRRRSTAGPGGAIRCERNPSCGSCRRCRP